METKKVILDFLCAIEGYHSLLKTLHWSTKNHSEHILTDEIDSSLLEYEDKLAENAMGRLNTRFGVGDLKTLLPQAKTLDGALKELESDINEVKSKLDDDKKYAGIINILDDFCEDINKWNYLKTLA